VVVKGVATVVRGEEQLKLQANESLYIDVDEKHQLKNESENELEVVEVQTGQYFGEDDITRYEDNYGRF
jgi:mannose-1-phosphate guanylyltransferase/mannose-6-phosphate isomerase